MFKNRFSCKNAVMKVPTPKIFKAPLSLIEVSGRLFSFWYENVILILKKEEHPPDFCTLRCIPEDPSPDYLQKNLRLLQLRHNSPRLRSSFWKRSFKLTNTSEIKKRRSFPKISKCPWNKSKFGSQIWEGKSETILRNPI